jgi:hypothetical protein
MYIVVGVIETKSRHRQALEQNYTLVPFDDGDACECNRKWP